MASGQTGTALRPSRRTKRCVKRLRGFAKGAKAQGDTGEWRRARAVILYIEGKRVIEARGAESRADFAHKVSIAAKEMGDRAS